MPALASVLVVRQDHGHDRPAPPAQAAVSHGLALAEGPVQGITVFFFLASRCSSCLSLCPSLARSRRRIFTTRCFSTTACLCWYAKRSRVPVALPASLVLSPLAPYVCSRTVTVGVCVVRGQALRLQQQHGPAAQQNPARLQTVPGACCSFPVFLLPLIHSCCAFLMQIAPFARDPRWLVAYGKRHLFVLDVPVD